jgi:uncharacterized protein (TIGR04222 family)
MPNPFDLRGPEFLVFYLTLGVLVTVVVAVLRRRSESTVVATGPLVDYLKIAYLRGGSDEALRVAILALIDRGLVTMVGDDRVQAALPTLPAGLQRTEQRLLESCKDVTPAHELVSDESLKMTVLTECEGHLVKAGLLPDANVKAARMTLLLAGVSLLSAVAILKILIALSRGRTNVLFLVVACVIFAFLVYRVANPFRTWAGEAMLADQRTLFSALKARAVSMAVPTGSNDLALLAAVFGTASLPAGLSFPKKLFHNPQQSTSGWSGGCGSGGSSCGSSCGGGCGGGCGGCGG